MNEIKPCPLTVDAYSSQTILLTLTSKITMIGLTGNA